MRFLKVYKGGVENKKLGTTALDAVLGPNVDTTNQVLIF